MRAIYSLLVWAANPTNPLHIFQLLDSFSDEDIEAAMHVKTKMVARIAWLEYGRRRGFHDFAIGVTSTDEEVHLTFTAPGQPLHAGPLFDVN